MTFNRRSVIVILNDETEGKKTSVYLLRQVLVGSDLPRKPVTLEDKNYGTFLSVLWRFFRFTVVSEYGIRKDCGWDTHEVVVLIHPLTIRIRSS